MLDVIESIRAKLNSLEIERVDEKIESIIDLLDGAKKDPTIWNLAKKEGGHLHFVAIHENGHKMKLVIKVESRRRD